jgi:hypothetical protein
MGDVQANGEELRDASQDHQHGHDEVDDATRTETRNISYGPKNMP